VRPLVDDVRYSWRQLRQTPGFTVIAVLTLALGIGATSAVHAIAGLLFPAGQDRPADLYSVSSKYPGAPRFDAGMQRADFRALEARRPASLLAVTALDGGECVVQRPGQAEYAICEYVTAGFADTFGVRAVAGRWFAPEDERPLGGETAVISHRLWQEWFGADRAMVGAASIRIAGARRRIVGVAPPGFYGQLVRTDAWLLQPSVAGAVRPPEWWKQPRWPGVRVLVRRRPGAPAEEARAQIAAVVTAASAGPESSKTDFAVQPVRAVRPTLGFWIVGFAALVFLGACANLANMLYARGTRRAAEMAVRFSLGASRARVVRLLMAEAAIVSSLGAAAGLAMAVGFCRWFGDAFPFVRLSPYSRVGVATALDPDLDTFLVAVGLGAAAALSVGLAGAWRVSRTSGSHRLAGSTSPGAVSSPARGLQTSLVSIQITAALLMVLAATYFLANTRRAYDQRVGFDTSRLTAARFELARYEQDLTGRPVPAYTEPRGRSFFERLLKGARGTPGVAAAALSSALPGSTNPAPLRRWSCFRAEDPADGVRDIQRRADGVRLVVSPEFLKTIGAPVRRGRDLAPGDGPGAPPVAVVSASLAGALWPGGDVVGRRLFDCVARIWVTVVGVSGDVVTQGGRPDHYVFVPFAQHYQRAMLLVVQSGSGAQVDAMRALARTLDPEVAVFDAAPVDDLMLAGVALQRAIRTLALLLGGLALAIAMLGVYGVIAYFVGCRTREFGVRLALGATRGQVLKLVVDRAIHIVLVGLVPAVLLASLGYRYLTNVFRNFLPGDLSPWIQVPVLMLAAGVLAALVPAVRAARVDPVVALRAE